MNFSYLRHPFSFLRAAAPVKLQAIPKASRRQRIIEMGAGGVSYIAGIISSDEFNEKLTGKEGVQMYDKMRRTDAQVAATINACTLPVLGADWGIDYPDDEAEAAKISDEHLDFARKNLFTRIDFNAFLHHACSSLWAGFSWFEQVYQVRDGYLWLAALSPRLATTLERWYVDSAGYLTGVQQWVYRDGVYTYVDYPRDKIALFTFGQEANNYQGESLLRAMYKHWYIKDVLYKIDAIRNERFAIGVPVITLPEEYDDDLYDMAQEIGEKWKGAEQSYVVKVQGMEIEILQVKGGEALNLLPTIQHHNEEIPKVGLAQFLNYGMTQTGSRALGETTTEFFYDAEEAWAQALARTMEREILWPLMDFNFEGQIRPQVTCANLGAVSLGELVETLRDVGERYVRPTADIENALRTRLNLSPVDESIDTGSPTPPVARRAVDEDVEEEEPDDGTETRAASHSHVEHLAISPYWRPLRPTEEQVDLTRIQEKLDRAQDRIWLVLLGARDEWVVSLAQQIRDNFAGGPKAIAHTSLPPELLAEPRNQLLAIQQDLFVFGQQQVFKEIRKQAQAEGIEVSIPPVREQLRHEAMGAGETDALVEARTEIQLTRLKRTTEEAAWQIAIGQYRTRGADDLSEADIQEMLDAIFSRVEKEASLVAGLSVTETLNLGRDYGFQTMAEQIRIMELSAIMDERTCDVCWSIDSKQAKWGSEEYFDLMPPIQSRKYGSCLGKSRCRCIWVAILKTEKP